MASRSLVLPSLMLILLSSAGRLRCCAITVDPPEDLAVFDLGRLGGLEITWSPPKSLGNMTGCLLQYQLEYFNAHKDRWETLRTPMTSHRAQFDLSRDVLVRVYSVVSGGCADNATIKSRNCTEVVLKPPSTGVSGSEAREFVCVYHNMENLECSWTRSPKTPRDAQQNLYFWHKSLQQAEECPSYLLAGRVRMGCNFTGKALPEFTDVYFCVNGSSVGGPLKMTFFTLQIQNQVKAAAPDKLHLQASSDGQLHLRWENPAWRLHVQCLEWEVRRSHAGADGRTSSSHIHTKNPSLTLPFSNGEERNCFKVRSRLNLYCVDRSFWSDWSQETCHPALEVTGVTGATSRPETTFVSVYIYIAVATIVTLVVSLCVWAAVNMRKSGPEKKMESLLPKLLPKNLTKGVSKVCRGKKICTDVII